MDRSRRVAVTHSPEETIELGQQLGKNLLPNSVLCFFGDLGAGKTTMIKGIVQGVTGTPVEEVNSPTYIYLQIYGKQTPLFHFDLYRLHNEEEFLSMGFEEYFSKGGVCCIEWSERIAPLLPPQYCNITLTHRDPSTRHIEILWT